MTDELPPKMVKAQLVRLDDSLKQIERRQVAGIQRAPGSLPVLEAFQAFLENEQRKARRRMMAVTAFAVLLFCAIGGTGFLMMKEQLRDAAAKVREVGNRTDVIAATVESIKRDQDAELLALENRFRDESSQIIAQYSSLQQEQQALATKNSSLETHEARLQQLEKENQTLQELLVAVRSGQPVSITSAPPDAKVNPPPQTAPDMAIAPAAQAATADSTNTTSVTTAATPATPAVNVVEHPLVYLMTIVPEGHTSGIRWMLPRLTQE